MILSNKEILLITRKTIYEHLIINQGSSCKRCLKEYDDQDLIKTGDCQCKFCKGCIKQIINQSTENKVIICEFEKSKYINLIIYFKSILRQPKINHFANVKKNLI